ncbi:alpha/beta fold hydrolase [Sphingomonas sp. MMS24-J13]|uniref:alpha/beta hydrolase n=1 Tax=Sphingomonas sp. MMS24-J13 TaxID=3238686 RepID=UPI00384F1DAF
MIALRGKGHRKTLPLLSAAIALALAGAAATNARPREAAPPIVLADQGSFEAGGTVIGAGATETACDYGHVEYQIPARARQTPLFLWHSSSVAVWQRRWDGGEGYQNIFLRRGFPVYLWDGPRVGRANYGCASYTYTPQEGRDAQSFLAWRLGPQFMEFYPGVQFPTADRNAWDQAVRARYDEFDTVFNAQLESNAAAKALDRIGPSVLVTNSAGGFRAMLTALKTDNVAGLVAYETPGFVFPEGEGPKPGTGPFGPVSVPLADFKKLTRFPIQLVYGDYLDRAPQWTRAFERAKEWVAIVNAHGGHAEVLHLPDRGLHGNTHIAFADLNNVAVADLLSEFLHRNGLDKRASKARTGR